MKYTVRLLFALVFLQCTLAGWANAQTVDLSTDEAVVEQFGKQKNEKFTCPLTGSYLMVRTPSETMRPKTVNFKAMN